MPGKKLSVNSGLTIPSRCVQHHAGGAPRKGAGGTLDTLLGTRWHTDSVRGTYAGRPRAGRMWAAGRAASRRPGSLSLEPRMPDPITTEPVLATAWSTRTGQY